MRMHLVVVHHHYEEVLSLFDLAGDIEMKRDLSFAFAFLKKPLWFGFSR
jgi:hypothetical protein